MSETIEALAKVWTPALQITQAMLDAWPMAWECQSFVTVAPFPTVDVWLMPTLARIHGAAESRFCPFYLPGMDSKGVIQASEMTDAHFARVNDWQWTSAAPEWVALEHPYEFWDVDCDRSYGVFRPAVFAPVDEIRTPTIEVTVARGMGKNWITNVSVNEHRGSIAWHKMMGRWLAKPDELAEWKPYRGEIVRLAQIAINEYLETTERTDPDPIAKCEDCRFCQFTPECVLTIEGATVWTERTKVVCVAEPRYMPLVQLSTRPDDCPMRGERLEWAP